MLSHVIQNVARSLVLSLALLLVSPVVEAEQPGKMYRMAFLSSATVAGAAPVRAILVEALGNLGYRQGQNLIVYDRYADGNIERLPALASELVRLQVEVIATQTTPAALAAKAATSTIPIVSVTGGDAVGSGLVASLARPGGNVTGLSFLGTELAVKQMEILKQIAPAAVRLALIANPDVPPEVNFFREMERAAPGLGVHVRFVAVQSSADYPAAFAAITHDHVDGLVVAASILTHDRWNDIVDLAARNRRPAIYAYRRFADAGGLISYGINPSEFFGRAALYIDKIFKGTKPADLPVEQPTKFELVINLRTAKTLGLTIPPSVLARADAIIEK
jgi:putative ABC transport system substrate-binding protein